MLNNNLGFFQQQIQVVFLFLCHPHNCREKALSFFFFKKKNQDEHKLELNKDIFFENTNLNLYTCTYV